MLLTLPVNAVKQEIWYNANGKPILVKDVSSGRMRVLSLDEVATIEKSNAQVISKQGIDPESNKPAIEVEAAPNPVVTDISAQIPSLLVPKIYSDNKYYIHRNNHHSPYYTSYPYISRPVTPGFSSKGYYRPVQYYRAIDKRNHHRSYNNNCGNGFLLRYSRNKINFRARF